jgi:hypothetical protein
VNLRKDHYRNKNSRLTSCRRLRAAVRCGSFQLAQLETRWFESGDQVFLALLVGVREHCKIKVLKTSNKLEKKTKKLTSSGGSLGSWVDEERS